MKSVTEFPNFTLNKALQAKAALTADSKSPDEIQQSLGETFKLEGDKLKHFICALDVAGQNTENLKRVVVISLNEGENAPHKATKVDDFHYVPEFYVAAKPNTAQSGAKGGRPRRGGGGDSKKGSPWGLSPEEKAAKTGKASDKAKATQPPKTT